MRERRGCEKELPALEGRGLRRSSLWEGRESGMGREGGKRTTGKNCQYHSIVAQVSREGARKLGRDMVFGVMGKKRGRRGVGWG